jgi:bisphosphoglycerate-dependent phosphoglycerate mutase
MTTSRAAAASSFVQGLPPLDPNSRRIVLLRDDEMEWLHVHNLNHYESMIDLELSQVGQQQAIQAQQELQGLQDQIGVVASSHVEIASQTADILHRAAFPSAVRVINPKFENMRFGEFEQDLQRRTIR